eukprot:COSAG01_NODE_3729_length_5755_cov_7.355135_2_plen_84_part_00
MAESLNRRKSIFLSHYECRSAPAGCVARPRGARGGVQSTRDRGRRPVACLLALDRCLLIENEGSSLGGPPDWYPADPPSELWL